MSDKKKNTEAKTPKRHFQYIDADGKATGRYSGVKPKQAGNKVFSSIWRERKAQGKAQGKSAVLEFKFAIRECTRNSRRKTYYYIGKREKLDKPTKVEIQDGGGETKTVVYNYSNKVMKDKEATKKAALKAKKEDKENKKNKNNKKNKKGKKKPVKKTAKKTKSAKKGKTTKKTTTVKKGKTTKKPTTKKNTKTDTKKASKGAKKPAKSNKGTNKGTNKGAKKATK